MLALSQYQTSNYTTEPYIKNKTKQQQKKHGAGTKMTRRQIEQNTRPRNKTTQL
jgi:hypothetical protein